MNVIILLLITLLSLGTIIISLLSSKKYKENCEDDHQVTNYNNVILVGGLLNIILVGILFFTTRKNVSKFAFG